ncbi:MAG: hypothetical protein K2J85_04135 [Anaeroplasmataceae bacterium]|nr:hypothetical protein [Anaeroplasmataceae bacterium]
MIYILYNDKSNRGKPIREAKKLEKKLKRRKKEVLSFSIFDIDKKEVEFHNQLTENDQLILIGGDGTLHYYFNQISPNPIPYRIFVKACGRGNDFARDYKKHKLFEITHLVNDLPKLKINEKEEYVFLNGMGMGVDSYVCQQQLQNAKLKIKQSYFKVALHVFKTFKPYSLDIEIDGVSHHFENVWFFVCNHGRYFGGGMKITPKAKREDDHLDICIVHDIKLWRLILIFPSVFLGLHRFIVRKKYLHFFTAKNVKVKPYNCNILQKDGEIADLVEYIEIQR